MQTDITEESRQEIRDHIKKMIEARKETMHLAHDEFNKGVKWATDYVMEFVDTYKLDVFRNKNNGEVSGHTSPPTQS